jgi:LacI family transcriptional regulator
VRNATLNDVAKAAGVSVSLVSLVLSGKAANRCSAATEAKIKKAAAQLGYRANRLARSLKEQQTRTLGMLSIEVATTPYAGEMLMAAQRAARLHMTTTCFLLRLRTTRSRLRMPSSCSPSTRWSAP